MTRFYMSTGLEKKVLPSPGEGRLILSMAEADYIAKIYPLWKKKVDGSSTHGYSGTDISVEGLFPDVPLSLLKKGLIIVLAYGPRPFEKVPHHTITVSHELADYFRVWKRKEEFSSMSEIELLTREYQAWLSDQHLPQVSADELIHLKLTPYQRKYVSHFILRWDAAENKE